MTTESLIINYGTNDRVGVYLFHHIIIVLYVCKRYYVAMPNGDIAGKIIILMILVFVEIKRLTVNYLSELSKKGLYLNISEDSAIPILKQTMPYVI